MQVILDSSFARPGSAPTWGGKKGEFRDWTIFDLNSVVCRATKRRRTRSRADTNTNSNKMASIYSLIPYIYFFFSGSSTLHLRFQLRHTRYFPPRNRMICFDTRSPLQCFPLHQIQLNFASCVGDITFLELMLTFKSGENGGGGGWEGGGRYFLVRS